MNTLEQDQIFQKQTYQKQSKTNLSYHINGISDTNNNQALGNDSIMKHQENNDLINNDDESFSYNYNMCSPKYPVDCHAHECTAACSAYHVAVQDISVPVQETIQDMFQNDFNFDPFTSLNQVNIFIFSNEISKF